YIISVVDEFNNPVDGSSGSSQWVEFPSDYVSVTGTGYLISPTGITNGNWGSYFTKDGKGTVTIGTAASDKGAGSIDVPLDASWVGAKDPKATAPGYTDPNATTLSPNGYPMVHLAWTVETPAAPAPTAAQKKLASDTAKLSKDTAALASAKSKLSTDTAKLAKDKKALKHAKGAKKKALKKAVKALKKAISADKKAVSAASSAVTADNKAIAADKAAIAAGK
ncbi:MAG: hypothetical protein ACXVE2_12280, partial [Solirubrobacteraceae bacterium]